MGLLGSRTTNDTKTLSQVTTSGAGTETQVETPTSFYDLEAAISSAGNNTSMISILLRKFRERQVPSR